MGCSKYTALLILAAYAMLGNNTLLEDSILMTIFYHQMSEDANNGIYQFHPHSKPISCLKFSSSDPNKLYTTSYDGLMRCCDLQTNVFEEVLYI